jgi:hypothetical protein
MKNLILEVKKKKEFCLLPDSLVERSLILSKQDIKMARALLRKYFGVFLTNKIYKLKDKEILKNHISSKNRDYSCFYSEIFKEISNLNTVVDLGCGVNGFSYSFLKERFKDLDYIGIEAVGQLVDKMNLFFRENKYPRAKALCLDLFDFEGLKSIFEKIEGPKAFCLFQIIDALEGFEKDYSKKLLLEIKQQCSLKDYIIISMSMKSISGKNKFEAKRGWLRWFLEENFHLQEFFINNERIFICRKR